MNVVVVGDTLLDRDISGTSTRLSPDGPVPVLDVQHTHYRPGGAGLVAALLTRAAPGGPGGSVSLVTALGEDESAATLTSTLAAVSKGKVRVVAGPSKAPTPVKTRLRAGGHPIARIDEGCAPAPIPEATGHMLEAIAAADVIIVADYGRGITSNTRVRQALSERGRKVPVVWDPHLAGARPVPECAVVTPNLPEAAEFTGAPAEFDTAFSAGEALRRDWGCRAVAVTAGERGVVLSRDGEVPLHLPARPAGDVDPCGAGDSFAAAVAKALGRGEDLAAAMFQGVVQTGEFLRGGGVTGLDTRLTPIRSGDSDAVQLASDVRGSGGTVVATGGCFDLLHAGHARTLAGARQLGDCLIVCVNSDESVRRLKGPGRPIMTQADRAELLASLECVDAVIVFEEDTPTEVLRELRPHVWVKGGDYTPEALPEAQVLAEWGGKVVAMPYHPGRSTTRLASAVQRVS